MERIPAYVGEVLNTLERGGFQAFCVGGCVRDCLLGRTPEDWDVTTSARPEELMALFQGRAIPTGLRHGTVTVRSRHKNVEVTTFRVDGGYADHRHPDSVAFTGSLEEDLSRRDFTVNAMALDLRGTITDPWSGQADLKAGVLRAVGEPEKRFQEDALRMMRGLRFSSVLGFRIESGTAAAIRRCRALLRDIAAERVREELTKLLCGAGTSPSMPWQWIWRGICTTPWEAGRTLRRASSGAWGTRTAGSTRTPCASSGASGSPPSWGLPLTRIRRRPFTGTGRCWGTSPRSASGRS